MQSLLRDSEAKFAPGALVGHVVDIVEVTSGDDAGTNEQFESVRWGVITENDATSLRVWGDLRRALERSKRYFIHDLTPRANASTVDRAPPGAEPTDLVGRERVDMPGTGSDPSIADVGPYEQSAATLGRCLSDCAP